MAVFNQALKTQLYTLLTGSADLSSIGTNFYFGRAPAGTEEPYLVIPELPLDEDDTFSNRVFELIIDFDIWSDSATSAEVEGLADALRELLRYAEITLTTDDGTWESTDFKFIRQRTLEEEAEEKSSGRLWMSTVRFRARFQKTA